MKTLTFRTPAGSGGLSSSGKSPDACFALLGGVYTAHITTRVGVAVFPCLYAYPVKFRRG